MLRSKICLHSNRREEPLRIFVYEFITGGGMWSGGEGPPGGSLLREGNAMLRALVADLVMLPGVETAILWDERLASPPANCTVRRIGSAEEERAAITQLAAAAGGVIVIAPESDGALRDRVRWVEIAGGRLLSPASEFVAVASNKNDTCSRLAGAGVPAPHGLRLEPGESLPRDFPYPAVLKPIDGAGSQEVFFVDGPDHVAANSSLKDAASPRRLEKFHPGMAASIAVLCGPEGRLALPACQQILSDDGRFRYLGGRIPLPPALNLRAIGLATSALEALPPVSAYVGIDLILGAAEDGSQDVVIEVNPRLTTSYVGLRRAIGCNLGELLIQVAQGASPSLDVCASPVQFTADGEITPNT